MRGKRCPLQVGIVSNKASSVNDTLVYSNDILTWLASTSPLGHLRGRDLMSLLSGQHRLLTIAFPLRNPLLRLCSIEIAAEAIDNAYGRFSEADQGTVRHWCHRKMLWRKQLL